MADFVNEKISLQQVALENYVSTENIWADYGGIGKASKLPTTGSVTRFQLNDTLVSNKWGLVPDMAGMALRRGLVRDDHARELIYTACVVEAEEAVALGLATRICADPLQAARELAHSFLLTRARHACLLIQCLRFAVSKRTGHLRLPLHLALHLRHIPHPCSRNKMS